MTSCQNLSISYYFYFRNEIKISIKVEQNSVENFNKVHVVVNILMITISSLLYYTKYRK